MTCLPQHSVMPAGRTSGRRRYQRRPRVGGLAQSRLVSRGTMAARVLRPPPGCSTWNVRDLGAPGHPESPPATSVGRSCALRYSIPRIAAERRNPREVSPSATILLDPPRQRLVCACSDANCRIRSLLAFGGSNRRLPRLAGRCAMIGCARLSIPCAVRRGLISGLDGDVCPVASLELTGRATRAVRSGIGRWHTPPEDPHRKRD